jgi:hypothetical protein
VTLVIRHDLILLVNVVSKLQLMLQNDMQSDVTVKILTKTMQFLRDSRFDFRNTQVALLLQDNSLLGT